MSGRRQALNRKSDEPDEKMTAGDYRSALDLLERDVRDGLVRWLEPQYSTSAVQPTRAVLLAPVDRMFARLEHLAAGGH